MNSGYFITGTDTGVGKTIVATILAMGLKALYWKPIQTGAVDGTDSEFVRQWLEAHQLVPEAAIFSHPSSPHIAAAREKRKITVSQVMANRPSTDHKVIIEGAGGVLVPLNESELMIHLIGACRLPTVIVARLRLGAINHTLLTVEALRRRSLPIAGFVSVGEDDSSVRVSIERYGDVPHLGHVPFCAEFSAAWFLEIFRQLRLP